MRLLPAIALLTLGACATAQTVWLKPGATQREFDMDVGQCQAQAWSVPNAGAAQLLAVLHGCMQGKGWHQAQR